MRLTISTRNARFQQWEALLTNRAKRHRSGEFLVQGVRPVTLAIENGWPIHALIHRHGAALSQWALNLVNTLDTLHVTMAGELLDELAEKSAEITAGGAEKRGRGTERPTSPAEPRRSTVGPELVAVVGRKPDELARIDPSGLTVVFDRPSSPGNVGTLIRSADAFGAGGVIVTGHAADVYDPKAVRASTGSLFCVPVVRLEAYPQEWLDRSGAQVVGLDESGSVELRDVDLTGPTILVVGNETHGMSAAWRDACHVMAHIPIGGGASSLNAAVAGSVALYEASRQRRV